jgi:hypothetical protein
MRGRGIVKWCLGGLATLGAVIAPASAGQLARAAGAGHRAHAAQSLYVKDSARLHLVSADGNTLVEQGRAEGNLPGIVTASFTLSTRTASTTFTIRASGGTIAGRGEGRIKPGKHGWDSFGGSLLVQRGSGRFHGAHGKGGLYGSIYRVTNAMSVQVSGRLYY